tara:strand:+ start:4823 stop:8932 length:4110 start_codon:yes stop_codon:yes gene_type:complete
MTEIPNQNEQSIIDHAEEDPIEKMRREQQDRMSEQLKESFLKNISEQEQLKRDHQKSVKQAEIDEELSKVGLGPGPIRNQMDDILDEDIRSGYVNRGVEYDEEKGMFVPIYTAREIIDASKAIWNRVSHIIHRQDTTHSDGIITTDEGETVGYAWINDYLDAVLSMADITEEQRSLITAYKTTPTPESFEEMWRQDPYLMMMLGKGAELSGEVLPEDLSNEVPVVPPMQTQDKETAQLTVDEDPRLRNEQLQILAKKEKNNWLNASSLDARLEIESWFLYVAGWTFEDFKRNNMPRSMLHPDTVASLEAAGQDLFGVGELSVADLSLIDVELIEDMDDETLEELAAQIGVTTKPEEEDEEEVDIEPWVPDRTAEQLIDDYFKDWGMSSKPTAHPVWKWIREIADNRKAREKAEEEYSEAQAAKDLEKWRKDRTIEMTFEQRMRQMVLDATKLAEQQQAEEDEELENQANELLDLGFKALTEGYGPETYKDVLELVGVLNTQQQEKVLGTSPWSRSMQEYRVAIAQQFNKVQGTDYEDWNDLMGAYFKNELSMMQEQWLMDKYDMVIQRTGTTRGSGGGSGSASNEENTRNFHNNNNYDASKIGPTLFVLGSMSDEEWADYANNPTKHMTMAFDRLSNDWDAYIKEKATLFAPDNQEAFIASYGTFADQAYRVQQQGSAFFADPVYAEFAGRAIAKEMVNNPNSGSRNNELATKVRTAMSFVANASSSFDAQMLAGAAHFMISLKAGAEATGNYGWFNDVMTDAGGGTFQAMAYDFVFRTLQEKSGGNWNNLNPQDVTSSLNSVSSLMITLSQVAQQMTELTGNTEVRSVLRELDIDPDVVMNLSIFKTSMGDLNTAAIDWKLNPVEVSADKRLEYQTALMNQYDEFLEVIEPIISQEQMNAGITWSRGQGLLKKVAVNLDPSEVISAIIWKSIQNTNLGRSALALAQTHGAIAETGPAMDTEGFVDHDYDMPGGAENRQQYELLNQYAFAILSSTPDRLDMFKGAIMTAYLAQAKGLPYDLNAMSQHLDSILQHQHGQLIPVRINPSDQIKGAPGDLELRTFNTDYRYHVAPDNLSVDETTYTASWDVWDKQFEPDPGEPLKRSAAEILEDQSLVLTRNLNELATRIGAPIEQGELEKAITYANEQADKIKEHYAKNNLNEKVGLTERHALALSYLIGGEEGNLEDPSGSWKDADPETKAFAYIGLRLIEDRSSLPGTYEFVFDENIRKDTRGGSKNPHVRISLSMKEATTLPAWMNLIAAEYKDQEIWSIDMSWLTAANEDWGDLTPEAIRSKQQDQDYVYFTPEEWRAMNNAGTQRSTLFSLYGSSEADFYIHDPEGRWGGNYEHSKWKPTYATNGSYSMVRVKIKK